jgi:hypothetical protein
VTALQQVLNLLRAHVLLQPLLNNYCNMSVCLQEVHDSLVSVEAEAERLFSAERSLMDADTQDRDRLYGRAQAVSRACCNVRG